MINITKGTFLKWCVPLLYSLLISCAPGGKNAPAAHQNSLSKITSMETINMAVGDSAYLNFKSLATAGYLWKYEEDKTGIVSISMEGTTQPSDIPPGQSVDEIFKIIALTSGVVHITFKQQRSWQKEAAPHAVKEYTVEVK